MAKEFLYILTTTPRYFEDKLDLIMGFLKKYLSETDFELFEKIYKDKPFDVKYDAAIKMASLRILENMEANENGN